MCIFSGLTDCDDILVLILPSEFTTLYDDESRVDKGRNLCGGLSCRDLSWPTKWRVVVSHNS